ncbi:MAG: helix-turn-helix domain-containing protein [Gammaproteobacteria bacterium]
MTQLCDDFGISRKTGYTWWRRYEAAGVDGLKERSRAPLSHPNAVKAAVVALLLQARQQHPAGDQRSCCIGCKSGIAKRVGRHRARWERSWPVTVWLSRGVGCVGVRSMPSHG